MGKPLTLGVLATVFAGCTLIGSRDGLVGSEAVKSTGEPDDASVGTIPATDAGLRTEDVRDALVDRGGVSFDASEAAPGPDVAPPSRTRELYASLLVPGGITVHRDDLCWVGGQQPRSLLCAPRGGGGPVVRIEKDPDIPYLDGAFDIALDDTYVYWSNGAHNQVIRRSRAGGDPAEYFSGGGRLSYLAINGAKIFATDYVDATSTSGGTIVWGPRGASSQAIYYGNTRAAGIAAVNTAVYWGRSSPDALILGNDNGDLPVTTFEVKGAVTGVAVDQGKTAYFIAGDRRIYSLAYGSKTPDLIYEADSPFGTSDIAVDDAFVYWTERDRGRIMRASK